MKTKIIMILFFMNISLVFPRGVHDIDIFNDRYSNDILEYYTSHELYQYTDLGHGLYLRTYYYNNNFKEPEWRNLYYNLNHNTGRNEIRFKELSVQFKPYTIVYNENSIEITSEARGYYAKYKMILNYNIHDKLTNIEWNWLERNIYDRYDFFYENNELKKITDKFQYNFDIPSPKNLETEYFYDNQITNPLDLISFEENWKFKNNIVIYDKNKLKYYIKIVREDNPHRMDDSHYTIFEYNENGIFIKETQYYPDGEIVRIIIEDIKYDERTHWVYCKYINDAINIYSGKNDIYEYSRRIVYR